MMHQVLVKQADGQWLWETSKHGFTAEEVTKVYTPYVRNYFGRIAIICNRYNELVSTIQWDNGKLTTRMLGYDHLEKIKWANLMIQEQFYREREQEKPKPFDPFKVRGVYRFGLDKWIDEISNHLKEISI